MTTPVRLSPFARAWRLLTGLLVVVGITAGTLIGDDKWWPFAPMSQYAFTVAPQGGEISSPYLLAVTLDGQRVPVELTPRALGMERSELEGQLPSLIADPSLLQSLAVLHARRQPEEPRWAAVEVRTVRIVLGEGGGRTDELLSSWQVRDPLDPERGR